MDYLQKYIKKAFKNKQSFEEWAVRQEIDVSPQKASAKCKRAATDFIEKYLDKALEGNKKPFEQWAMENGIDLRPKEVSAKTGPKSKRTKVFALRFAAITAAVVLLATCIVLLAVPFNTPQRHTSNDSILQWITLEEMHEERNNLLFNQEQIQIIHYIDAFRHVLYNNHNFILAYTISQLLFATEGSLNTFFIYFTVRVHRFYDFFNYRDFKNLTQSMVVNGVNIRYKILEDHRAAGSARVSFTYNNLSYFLTVHGFEGITQISTKTLTILLTEVFAG